MPIKIYWKLSAKILRGLLLVASLVQNWSANLPIYYTKARILRHDPSCNSGLLVIEMKAQIITVIEILWYEESWMKCMMRIITMML